ncbi:hypothetical protein Cgig2_011521 [Carnegiea gigantea]|uniref:Uncharacterized protein n=1 Tax=Carnegiea gigantea TaxID=171969 RepID=A0A9Q1JNZ8_9CARY|nr:hypothetical protein Cgig2_011521 [Carnegiea gigantea]
MEAMKMVMKNFSKPAKGVIIRDLDKNMFSLQVFLAVDKRFRIGHTLKGCEKFDDNMNESTLQYREWLGASLVKIDRRIAEAEKSEEMKFFITFRKSKETSKAMTKLVFHEGGTLKGPSLEQTSFKSNVSVQLMSVDEEAKVPVGNEVCKRKKSHYEATSRLDESKQTSDKPRNSDSAVKKVEVAG